MAADAIAGRILLALEDGEPLPSQSDVKAMKPEREDGFTSLVYVDTDELKINHDEKPVKKTLTIPSWLNQAAERKNINFSSTLKEALIEKIAKWPSKNALYLLHRSPPLSPVGFCPIQTF
jgi:hypothetical protein